MLGPHVLLTMKTLYVEDQAIGGSIQVLPFFFIGPLSDKFIESDFCFSRRADEVDWHLFSFFQDPIGFEVEEFAPNVLRSSRGVEAPNKVSRICLLLFVKVSPNVHELVNLGQKTWPRRRKEGSEGLM